MCQRSVELVHQFGVYPSEDLLGTIWGGVVLAPRVRFPESRMTVFAGGTAGGEGSGE